MQRKTRFAQEVANYLSSSITVIRYAAGVEEPGNRSDWSLVNGPMTLKASPDSCAGLLRVTAYGSVRAVLDSRRPDLYNAAGIRVRSLSLRPDVCSRYDLRDLPNGVYALRAKGYATARLKLIHE